MKGQVRNSGRALLGLMLQWTEGEQVMGAPLASWGGMRAGSLNERAVAGPGVGPERCPGWSAHPFCAIVCRGV